jgi:hypothetical protein
MLAGAPFLVSFIREHIVSLCIYIIHSDKAGLRYLRDIGLGWIRWHLRG